MLLYQFQKTVCYVAYTVTSNFAFAFNNVTLKTILKFYQILKFLLNSLFFRKIGWNPKKEPTWNKI